MFAITVYLVLGIFALSIILTYIHYLKLAKSQLRKNKRKMWSIRNYKSNSPIKAQRVEIHAPRSLLKNEAELRRIMENVIYFKASGKKVDIIYVKGMKTMRGTIEDCEKRVKNKDLFVRISKECLVNVKHIQSINDKNVVQVIGGTTLPLGNDISKSDIEKLQSHFQGKKSMG